MRDNYPYFHPQYAGQMLKPPHAVARLAYALAMWINPNNHALDGGRASSRMEKEAVAAIARMFGWHAHLGHLCGGGTMANLEALWVAGQLSPGAAVLASSQAHYTHGRISAVLGLPFEAIPCDRRGRGPRRPRAAPRPQGRGHGHRDHRHDEDRFMDPAGILALGKRHGFRARRRGVRRLLRPGQNLLRTRRAYDRLAGTDSIVIDPHTHGLQPYGCGCVLFRDPSVGRFYKHDSPYTYFSSTELHLGEISLECSRPGASAVALWATQRLLPLERGGEFARGLEACRTAALALHARISRDPRFVAGIEPELDIVVWAARGSSGEDSSDRARRTFDEAARRGLHLALAELPGTFFGLDAERVTCLRSVLMKPEHLPWLDRIWAILSDAADAAG
jgi:glutamate/tyrosine decarboxylase-like PLP-dependent enzyme